LDALFGSTALFSAHGPHEAHQLQKPMKVRWFVISMLLAVCVGRLPAASAQPFPRPGHVAALFLASELRGASGASLASTDEAALAARSRRARWLLASGIGLSVGSAVGVAVAGRAARCGLDIQLDKTAPRSVAGVFGAAGLTITAFGAARLAGVPAGERRRPSAREQLRLSAGAFVLGTVAFTLISLSAVPEWSRCFSS
jgi:hypothetical protein